MHKIGRENKSKMHVYIHLSYCYNYYRLLFRSRATSIKETRNNTILLLLLLLRLFVTRKIPSRRPQMRYLAVRKCCCLYTMYHINNNAFSCVLKVVRLQSDIRNAVGKQICGRNTVVIQKKRSYSVPYRSSTGKWAQIDN